jgi:hypothetical protein
MNHRSHKFKIGDLIRVKEHKDPQFLGVVLDIRQHEEEKTEVLVIHWTDFGFTDDVSLKMTLDRYRKFFHTLDPELLSHFSDPPEEKKKKVLYTAQ